MLLVGLILLSPFVSGGLIDWYNSITGKATSDEVVLNISVTAGTAPTVPTVYNNTITDVSSGLNEGPTKTTLKFNFTASDAEGYTNLNDSSAAANFTLAGETTREGSCTRIAAESSGNLANYSCSVDMFWWDGTGAWSITASIKDVNNNGAQNASSTTFSVGTTAGVTLSPTTLAWASISPGATNSEATSAVRLNNTGNLDRSTEVNGTSLKGETNNAYALWAGNFTVKNAAGCGGETMSEAAFVNITSAHLPAGNFTIADGNTGQEDLYFCLELAGTELTQQAYSTDELGPWIIQIVA